MDMHAQSSPNSKVANFIVTSECHCLDCGCRVCQGKLAESTQSSRTCFNKCGYVFCQCQHHHINLTHCNKKLFN